MLKGLSVSAVIALLAVTTSAHSGFGFNMQTVDTGTTNWVGLVGDGCSANTNVLTIDVSQLNTNDVRHTTAFQGVNGAITQSAAATGMGTLASTWQNGGLEGVQIQNPNTGQQWQDLDSHLGQMTTQSGGTGTALGIETVIGIGTQLVFNTYGATANVQAIGDTLYGAASGTCGESTVIGGGSNISLGQISM